MRLKALCLALALAAPADAEQAVLATVMDAVRADRWEKAWDLADRTAPVARDIVTWRWLRAGQGDFEDYRAFLARNPDWPGLDRLRAEGEGKIPGGGASDAVIGYFGGKPPHTGTGALRLVQAHAARDEVGDAQAMAVLAWRTLVLSENARVAFLARFRDQLAPHHEARIDAMLWDGHFVSARRMLPLVPEGWEALVAAREALRKQAPGVDALIDTVPEALKDDPGLAYERFLWRARKGRNEDAIALLDARSGSADSLGRPEAWAGWRRVFARTVLSEFDPGLAYRLASRHHLATGSDYADLEWLSGFIALRFLDDPETALAHFVNFEASVRTPISLGRAGYWQGRALEALGRTQEARAAYVKGGAHQTSFYGLLAAERAGLTMDPALTGREALPDWRDAPWAEGSVVQAARLFHEAGERNLMEWFLTHLAETAGPEGQRQIAGLALELDEPHVAVRIAKVAARDGNVIMPAYFPVTELAAGDHPVPTELVLAIARRESEFDPAVGSGAGARGLMQLMPGTAQAMARKLGVEHSDAALLTDPDYNAELGAAYLAQLIAEFGANPVLVSVGYNAGPGRARRWSRVMGDPRAADVDVVDWIEMIPFRETRNYVMRVAESLPVYRARLTGDTAPLRLSEELKAR
ncbi:lytic transglycosylase domain-containing protein [Rhodovulum sp. ES.010]|uniref:lytic transglycosylase domain-containing protein n=1 Tax=Rhodovulum sp. ES.010 TaxID=1882821 RepID=UPI0009412FF4|nr:lytic transglycosylase domain-containing protein [Rhodovulum sp. ES.010]